jgi:hypothetical protein
MCWRLGSIADLVEHGQGGIPVAGLDRGRADDLGQLELHVADAHPGREVEAAARRRQRDLGVVGSD